MLSLKQRFLPDTIVPQWSCLFVLILQHWDVFKYVTEIFILVPALLGLKGNLEMTLASRLSTAVSIQGAGRESHGPIRFVGLIVLKLC